MYKRLLKFALIFILIFAWIFSSWPAILSFAQEATPTATITETVTAPSILPRPTPPEPPDFSQHLLRGVYTNVPEVVAAVVEKVGTLELWLYNVIPGSERQISTDIAADFPMGLKGGFFFWLSKDRAILYAYHPEHNEHLSQPVPAFDPAKGERARMHFPGILWQVIVDNHNFYFFSQETGEVFSDGSSSAREEFGARNNLHKFISEEQMGHLGFTIQQSIDESNVY